MLKNKSKIVVFLIAIIMLVSTISFATEDIAPTSEVLDTATETTTENPPVENTDENLQGEQTIPEEEPEIYNGDLYLFDNNVVMDKLVDGNVFICGQNIEITGRVNGSLFVIGNKVSFAENSYVVQSIYACANELTLNGAANDLYAMANKIDMSYNSFMIRDLRATANTFNFNGGVGRDAFVKATNFNFGKEADKSAVVYGNLTYSTSQELELSKDLVQGDINYSKYDVNANKNTTEIVLDKAISLCGTLLYTAIVFLLAAWLAPKFVEKSASNISTKAFKAFGIGVLGFIVATAVSFGLLFSYIGVPVAFAILGILVLMMSISFAITAICITFKAKEKFKITKKPIFGLALILVTIILWALQQIPYVGWVVSMIVTFLGFGIILLYLFTKNKKVATKEVKE